MITVTIGFVYSLRLGTNAPKAYASRLLQGIANAIISRSIPATFAHTVMPSRLLSWFRTRALTVMVEISKGLAGQPANPS